VGHPYSPTLAQLWLAQAGYPNGQGLPAVTLSFNESSTHQAIAEYVRESWYATLGVSATLEALPWPEFFERQSEGAFQVSRSGWGMDYPDAHSFLADAVLPNRTRFGDWDNPTYDELLDLAALAHDPNLRRALYRQAEEILVETDAIMIPLYYYASPVAAKPYLNRTYGVVPFDISTWRIWQLYLPLTISN
jgi:oligopeptide transport system substrate-binding protein